LSNKKLCKVALTLGSMIRFYEIQLSLTDGAVKNWENWFQILKPM